MGVHSAHPGPAERSAFLVDGCDRCAEYVEDMGLQFDQDRFRAFWAKMCRVEYDDVEGYASKLDRDLGRRLYAVSLALHRAYGFDARGLAEADGELERAGVRLTVEQRAFIRGLSAYAWWRDGVEYVGTTGTTFNQAVVRYLGREGVNVTEDHVRHLR